MTSGGHGGTLGGMPLWAVTVIVLATVWAVGSAVVALGALRLVRRQPD